jgi:hypothetical protein
MKRNLIALTALAAIISAPVFAAEHEGWVYNGNTGVGMIDGDQVKDDSFSSNASIGYRWGVVGVEGGYAWFGSFTDKATTPVGKFNTEVDPSGWTAGINLNGDLSDKWSVQGRVGAFFWNADSHLDVANTRVKFSESGTDWYAGLSIDYRWSPFSQWAQQSGIGLGYTYFKMNDRNNSTLGLIGLHTEFRF